METFADRVIAISGESLRSKKVCTFQIHSRRRVNGRLKSVGSRSITIENVSLKDGLRIIKLGMEELKRKMVL